MPPTVVPYLHWNHALGFALIGAGAFFVFRGPGWEHDPEKWEPVFGKDHAQPRNPGHDPIQLNRIMV
jgi:hypothetical protein